MQEVKHTLPNVGDFVEVDTIIRDGEKQRIQKFRGVVIATSGKSDTATFTVRKISYGVGVEKIFPIASENIGAIKIEKASKVRRSKLYYLRERIGKAAMKLKPGKAIIVPEENTEDISDSAEAPVEEVKE